MTLPVDAFIARFLEHVLPRGFTKIRYYGLLSPTGRPALARARHLLALHAAPRVRPAVPDASAGPADTAHVALVVAVPAVRHCPACGHRALRLVARYRRSRAPPS